MIKFEHTYYLYGLLLIPVFVLIYILLRNWKKRALLKFGDLSVTKQLMPDMSSSRPLLKFILLSFAYIFIILSLANPQIGSKLEKIKRKGVDIVIALDISNSMLAQDIKPNRLERAKNSISKLIDKLKSDRIGIVVFAGKAYTQLPITTDHSAAKMFLHTINPSIIGVQGTAIGAAIEQAESAFDQQDAKNKALIIISDGENHEDDALLLAKSLAEKNIIVHTIGMGSPDGVPIPLSRHFNKFKKDKTGGTIVTKLNEVLLQQIAAAGKGTYVRATNSKVGLKKLYKEIRKMEETEFESKMYADYEDRFQYFLAAGLFFLLIELLIFERKSKWASKFNLFK